MANPKPLVKRTRYYFYDDASLIVYYSDELPEDSTLIYLGTSDNPNPKMAVGAFTQDGKITKGYTIMPLP